MEASKEEILERLEKLERENRWLKRSGVAAAALASLFVILGVASPVPQTLTAHQILLTDSSGRVRVKLSAVGRKFPFLALYGPGDRTMLSLDGGGTQPGLAIHDVSGKTRILLGGLSPDLSFYNAAGDTIVSLDGSLGPRLMLFDSAGKLRAEFGGQGPTLSLIDSSDYETDVGVSSAPNPLTGDMQQTTAASIVMFKREGQERKYLWRAPQPPRVTARKR
jgi:hypothetical protein